MRWRASFDERGGFARKTSEKSYNFEDQVENFQETDQQNESLKPEDN